MKLHKVIEWLMDDYDRAFPNADVFSRESYRYEARKIMSDVYRLGMTCSLEVKGG